METFSLPLNSLQMIMERLLMTMILTMVRVLMILMMMVFSSCISFLFLPNSLYFGRIVQGYWWMGVLFIFPLTFPPIVVHIHHILAMCEQTFYAVLTFSQKNNQLHTLCKSNQHTPSSSNYKYQLMKITLRFQFLSLQ